MKAKKKETEFTQLIKVIGLIGVTSLVLAFVTGCSKSKSGDNKATPAAVTPESPADPTVPGADSSGGKTYSSGSTVEFKPHSLQIMNNYVATRPLNNPTNFKINVNLTTPGVGIYGGEVSISYLDNGIQYEGIFRSGLGKNANFKGMYDNDKQQSEFNYWFTFNKKKVFSGMFEDEFGAIAIVLEPETSIQTGGNDAEPVQSGKYKGTIFYKNFTDQEGRPVFGPHSPYRSCWHTYKGVYDCRSNVVMTKCHLNPGVDAGYKSLGTFTGIEVKAAFNIN